MKIRNGSKSLSFTIEEYQYPSEKSHGDDYNYDANWLNVVIEYSDETGIKHYRDACLLTYELENCAEKIHKIISGEEMLYFSDFMEPYLNLLFHGLEIVSYLVLNLCTTRQMESGRRTKCPKLFLKQELKKW